MTSHSIPSEYVSPEFPSLYFPFSPLNQTPKHIYHMEDAWRFTLYWTLAFYGGTHMAVALYAMICQRHSWKLAWAIPLVYAIVAGLEGLLAGSVVGLILGLVYEAGSFKMSTWIPFAWGCINVLVLILSSFSFHGGL
ncbi:hypothetical protein H112_05752 [Trichophyton rubrum D6]|uniref:Integral membrane protein n=2 Tax=Trichophyton TaxID=5550 RepID=A0A022VYZ4_TRIRU|nr:hypothetical protein H100_05769 [Trichophyton rubrum MR850]EZF40445.1 hypothetical protein H102_05737 [Trichophyton rubrum CBS 100081]EZF50953.1 hypothetical protein H103_05765 [Trichophyton rubrum CBS 288.86]EZF61668.1 hypothetical protein H104_05749 [Trichophyton rubrum CBS 289.86]EZF72057.1 hypothetical protein H105_05778 [Trichophyton soudanense CBS 452.61]EZF82779.1 hypothetical protein H110_05758 [Trichophyton rubrum MR1448]EZF93638.1 hypothetical protein H113_05806 [Trichophyton rub